jgi:hypothetical protein
VKFGIIMDVEASRAIRQAEVGAAAKTMIERTEQRFDIKPERLAGDTAYGSGANLNWLVNEAKIAPHIPVVDKSKREGGIYTTAATWSLISRILHGALWLAVISYYFYFWIDPKDHFNQLSQLRLSTEVLMFGLPMASRSSRVTTSTSPASSLRIALASSGRSVLAPGGAAPGQWEQFFRSPLSILQSPFRRCPLTCNSIFDALDFNIDALADLAPITGAGGQELARFFRSLGLDAPFLHASDVHGRVEGLERGLLFEGGNGHGLLQ